MHLLLLIYFQELGNLQQWWEEYSKLYREGGKTRTVFKLCPKLIWGRDYITRSGHSTLYFYNKEFIKSKKVIIFIISKKDVVISVNK